MDRNTSGAESKPGVSKLKLALGAVSLFLFIVGLKRSLRVEDGPDAVRYVDDTEEEPAPAERPNKPRSG